MNQTATPRTVQLAKNTLLANNNNFTKTGTQVCYVLNILIFNNILG